MATTTLGGRTYDVWKTSDNSYIALVSTITFSSGSVDLLEIFDWTISQGWLPSSSTLSQIDSGVEIVSTNGAANLATYQFSDFSHRHRLISGVRSVRKGRSQDARRQGRDGDGGGGRIWRRRGRFYEGTLGLQVTDASGSEAITFASGRSKLIVYRSQYAGTNKATALNWNVGDGIERDRRGAQGEGSRLRAL